VFSGHASVCPEGRLLVIENLSNGFDLYTLPRVSPLHAFVVPTTKTCIKDGVFGEEASVVACGSDHGTVYVFSTSSAKPKQVIKQAGKSVDIQAISVSCLKLSYK